jgi:hypothetical protein
MYACLSGKLVRGMLKLFHDRRQVASPTAIGHISHRNWIWFPCESSNGFTGAVWWPAQSHINVNRILTKCPRGFRRSFESKIISRTARRRQLPTPAALVQHPHLRSANPQIIRVPPGLVTSARTPPPQPPIPAVVLVHSGRTSSRIQLRRVYSVRRSHSSSSSLLRSELLVSSKIKPSRRLPAPSGRPIPLVRSASHKPRHLLHSGHLVCELACLWPYLLNVFRFNNQQYSLRLWFDWCVWSEPTATHRND